MGFCGASLATQESPDFTNLGASSRALPERRSTLERSSVNLQAMWAVWQSSTGVYPAWIWPGWFKMMTWAVKEAVSLAGSFLESEATLPRRISLTETFFTLKPTLSPGTAWGRDSWCISTDLTSVVTLAGAKVTTWPGLRIPVSTRPTGTVPIPPILYTSWRGRRRGLSVGRLGGFTASRASRRIGPLYQPVLVERSIMLSPFQPEMGTKLTLLGS
mmetsp:Transcript_56032/g.132142  ORF Transcript_56032/g.132142 Transcript_56032/m.132142 type:complete len:216 (-) Transcript_56032:603-1250(-)